MLDILPTELAIAVIRLAAHSWRFTDRRTVVNLATTSSFSYQIVAPILYHTVILSNSTVQPFIGFTTDVKTAERARRVCAHVRVLHNFTSHPVSSSSPIVFEALEEVCATGNVIQHLAEAHSPCPFRRITLRSSGFRIASSTWLPLHARSGITHICGYLPIFRSDPSWAAFSSDSRQWIRDVVDPLPGLTHLGLVLINVGPPDEVQQTVQEFSLAALAEALKEALNHPKLECVALRVCGVFVQQRWEEIVTTLAAISDARVMVWRDSRLLPTWEHYEFWMIENVEESRDLWTEAQSLTSSFNSS